jgi:integrase
MSKRGDGRVYQPTYTVRQPNGSRIRKTSAVWWIQYSATGKQLKEGSESTDRKKAEKLLKLRTAQAMLGKAVTPEMARATFANLRQMLVDDYKMNGLRSVARIETAMDHLAEFFGERLARDITTDRVTAYVVDRLSPRKCGRCGGIGKLYGQDDPCAKCEATGEIRTAEATVNRELAALKRAFTLALRARKVSEVPHIAMLPEGNARQGFLTHAEFERLHASLPDDLKDPVEFLYLSGWRVGEARSLEWRDVDLEQMVVRLRIENSKTKRPRVLPLRGKLAEIMERARAGRSADCPFVFRRDGHALGLFRKSWASACKAAGLGKILVHDLRRTAVRNLVRAGVPDTTAMSITGHKTRSIFDRYNITSESDQALAIEQVGAYLAARPKTASNVVPLRSAQEQPKIAAGSVSEAISVKESA